MIDTSVVLPVRNGTACLKDAIASVQSQTHAIFEIIVVDDGSDDGGATRRVIEMLADQDSRIRPLFLRHQGIAGALNAGIATSSGRYIARMDADDWCLPGRLRHQIAYLDNHPDIGLVSCLVRFGGDSRQHAGYAAHVRWANRIVSPHDIQLGLFRESPLPHPSVMFRRDLIDRFGGYKHGDFPEDYELWLRFRDAGVRMSKVEKTLLVWNDPPDRLSRTSRRYAPERFHAIKAASLATWLRKNNRHHPEIYVWGAGKMSRAWAEMLVPYGIVIRAYIDVDVKKIGNRVQGRPVIHFESVSSPDDGYIVSFVGSRGAGERVQGWLNSRGFILGQHYILAS